MDLFQNSLRKLQGDNPMPWLEIDKAKSNKDRAIFDTSFNDIRKRLGTLKDLTNYQNITKLIENINSVTKSKNKIEDYEDNFNSLKSERLETEKIEFSIAQLNEEIAKEENLIKGSVISLKEEIDTLDAELSKKKDLWKYLKLPIPFNPFALLQILKSISINKDF